MKKIKFSKTECGVDFLLNVFDLTNSERSLIDGLYTADFFQIVFIEKGNGRLILNNKSIAIKENSVVFITQNQKYKWIFDENEFHLKFLVFQEDFLNDFFADQYFSYRLHFFYQTDFSLNLNLSQIEFKELIDKLEEIKYDIENTQRDSIHLIRSILYYVLIKLNRLYTNWYSINCFENKDNTALMFRKLVEQNIITHQRIEDYTQLLNISRITLNKAVRAQFNCTASDFIKSRLIYEIKMRLIYSRSTIEEISQDLNFSEANHLTRFFKTQTSLTPTQYRESSMN